MYESDRLEVWNLTPHVAVLTGAQPIFNVVGRVKSPHTVERLSYCLNGGPERPVFFNRESQGCGRLEQHGDFNIDTLEVAELKPLNRLQFCLRDNALGEKEEEIVFPCRPFEAQAPCFRLQLQDIAYPQQVGQIVDGKWRVSRDERGEPCLEIRREDTGLDRIIVFGRHDWTTAYEITARLCVTAWTAPIHNVGLVFKWNPHRRGDGTSLPTQWSTGLGYYYSHCPGLRIRFGVNVHLDLQGRKVGDYILQEHALSPWHHWLSRIGKRVFPRKLWFSQIVPGTHYRFRLRIHPDQYALTVWKDGRRETAPQLLVRAPLERLVNGSAGIIAHHCAVRVYELNVSPVE